MLDPIYVMILVNQYDPKDIEIFRGRSLKNDQRLSLGSRIWGWLFSGVFFFSFLNCNSVLEEFC